MTVAADLGSSTEIEAMFTWVAAELGPVGVLVTATSAYRSERIAEITDESWAAVVDDLLGATFRTCRAAVPGMPKSIPVRRLATPDDLATLVVWLGSGANTYVSGETISLTGGDQR